ncbi:hypothetical protein JCM18897A_19430 [Streptomyces sp. JCM 18897]
MGAPGGRAAPGPACAGRARGSPSPQPPGQYLRSRLLLVGGGLLMAGAAALASGTARLVAVVVVGVGAVAAWALYDHRTERRRGDSA